MCYIFELDMVHVGRVGKGLSVTVLATKGLVCGTECFRSLSERAPLRGAAWCPVPELGVARLSRQDTDVHWTHPKGLWRVRKRKEAAVA